jgi:cardiolipin synthase
MSWGKKSGAYYIHNSVSLLRGGKDYFERLHNLFNGAKKSIYIRIYIWQDDYTGTSIANTLISAAKKGVHIHIIADGYASRSLPKNFIQQLAQNNIQFRLFEPFLRSSHFYFGRRMHDKVIVIDEQIALVGGINFADRYNDVNEEPAWLDYAIEVKGETAFDLYRYCYKEWHKKQAPPLSGQIVPFDEICSVRPRYNDWVKGKQQIWKTYFNWFNHAEEEICILCSYFLPGNTLRKRLALAAKRGVEVKLILSGTSDVALAKYAERYLYRWMMRNRMRIFEYRPTVLHAKLMVVDRHWVTVGSFNVNNISTYASTEVNVDVRNKPFATKVQSVMEEILQNDCTEITTGSPLYKAGIFTKIAQRFSYDLIRLILKLTTFYFKRE